MNRPEGVPSYLRPQPRRVLLLRPMTWTAVAGVGVLAAIELVARSGRVSTLELVPAETMVARAVHLLSDKAFLSENLLRSAVLVLISFLAATVLGSSLALAMYGSDWLRRAVLPYLNIYYAIPTFALYPAVVVIFGIGMAPIVVIATAFAMVAVAVNALNGFNSVPTEINKLAASLRLSRPLYLWRILLRSALPDIVVGVKLGLAYSIIAVLATEFILSTQGIGWYIGQAYEDFAIEDMYGALLLVAVLVLVANVGLGLALRRFDWRRKRK